MYMPTATMFIAKKATVLSDILQTASPSWNGNRAPHELVRKPQKDHMRSVGHIWKKTHMTTFST